MYIKITQFPLIFIGIIACFFGALFCAAVFGIYCQRWQVSGTKTQDGWRVRLQLKYLYTWQYKDVQLDGVSSLSLSSRDATRRDGGRSRSARLNTLSVLTASGETAVTHLVPYGLPAVLRGFINNINSKLSDPAQDALNETLVFNPLHMRDIFSYVFGGFFVLMVLLLFLNMAQLLLTLVRPVFIDARPGVVEYRSRVYGFARSVPVSELTGFSVRSRYELEDMPVWLQKLAPALGRGELMAKARQVSYPPLLALNFKDGRRQVFYLPDGYNAAALAVDFNNLLGFSNAAPAPRTDR